jgi:type II secretory pathway pseudopilin PulG
MLETLAVLGIIGLLTVGAISMYSRSKTNLRRMQVFDEVTDLSENIKTLFQGKTDYNLVSVAYLERYGALKTTRNAYGKDFVIRPTDSGRKFSIIYSDISNADCIFYGLSKWQGAYDVYINGVSSIRTDENQDLNCKPDSTNEVSVEFE